VFEEVEGVMEESLEYALFRVRESLFMNDVTPFF